MKDLTFKVENENPYLDCSGFFFFFFVPKAKVQFEKTLVVKEYLPRKSREIPRERVHYLQRGISLYKSSVGYKKWKVIF